MIERPIDVPDPDKELNGWGDNDRGVSFTLGADKVTEFFKKHELDLICRAHQVVEDGYEFFADRQLVAKFSAPNYCGEFNNAGAMMLVDTNLLCSFQILEPGNDPLPTRQSQDDHANVTFSHSMTYPGYRHMAMQVSAEGACAPNF